MVKRRPLEAITNAAKRPVNTTTTDDPNPEGKPFTVYRKPTDGEKWEDRTKRHTFHADTKTLEAFKKHSTKTKESLASLHNRAMQELLDRENKPS